jgi:hypothetical protein
VWVRTRTGLSPQIWSSDCFDRPAWQLAGVLLDHHPMSAAERSMPLDRLARLHPAPVQHRS